MDEFTRLQIWIKQGEDEIKKLDRAKAKIQADNDKYEIKLNELTAKKSRGFDCPQALGLCLAFACLILCGCSEPVPVFAAIQSPVHQDISNVQTEAHIANNEIRNIANDRPGDAKISELQSTLQKLERDATQAKVDDDKREVEYVNQLAQANKQAKENADKAAKLLIVQAHLMRCRISIVIAVIFGGLCFFLGPIVATISGSFAALIPNFLTGWACVFLGTIFTFSVTTILAIIGVL
jgi:hypothetical protein